MRTPRRPPRIKTVFDVAPNEVHGYQTLLDHLTEIGMAIVLSIGARQDLKDPEAGALPMFDKIEAFARASNAIVVTINLSHTLSGSRRRPGVDLSRRIRVERARSRRRDPDIDDIDDIDDDIEDELDEVLYRPINAVFGEACIDLAAAASVAGIPPWIATTPDYLRSMIVALARREAARLEAEGHDAPPPFSAQILDYKPRASTAPPETA